MFCDIELATRIERAETDTITAGSSRYPDGFVVPLAGGAASFAAPDSPLNKLVGLGFAGLPSETDLDGIEEDLAVRATPAQAEICSLADPAVAELLTERGYRLVSFENVLGMRLTGMREGAVPAGVDVIRCAHDEVDQWLDVVVDGFAAPDDQGVPAHEEISREVLASAIGALGACAGTRRNLALRDGVTAGGASMRIVDDVAQLNGAATAPPHRRVGVQTALLTTRLHEAAAADADIAVVTTAPGSKSQQNVQRAGFSLLYTRAILVKRLPH